MGGLKQYFLRLFDYLLAYDRANSYLFFYFKHNVEQMAELAGDWRDRAILLDRQEDISRELSKIDVYFCPFNALWPRPVKCPSVVTLVDIQEVFYPQFFTASELLERAYHYAGSTRAADRVVTISNYSKRTIVEHHRIVADKVVVADLCADPAYFKVHESAVRDPNESVPEPFVVYPANDWPHKNHDGLLRAVAMLKEMGVNIRVAFTGVRRSSELAESIQRYRLDDLVFHLGYVSPERLARLYSHARMLVFPSLFEGFGMPALEAMTAGCPVVVANSTSLPEICGDAAEYFDPRSPASIAEVMLRVWNDDALRKRLMVRGKERARAFSPERMAAVHLRAFAEAAEVFSLGHYYWHQYAYQPFHRTRASLKRRALSRLPAKASANLSLSFGAGWYGREQSGTDWLRWSSGSGRIRAYAPQPTTLQAICEMASLKRPNRVDVIVNAKRIASWSSTGEKFEFRPLPRLEIELQCGENEIRFLSHQRPSRTHADPRKLAFAVKNLVFLDEHGHSRCIDH